MMGFIAAIFLMIGVAIGFGADRLPPIGFKVPIVGTFIGYKSQAAKLADALDAQGPLLKSRDAWMNDDKANIVGLKACNTTVQANADRSQAALEETNAKLIAAQRGRKTAEDKAAVLLSNPPAGIDTCARFVSADDAVLESLK